MATVVEDLIGGEYSANASGTTDTRIFLVSEVAGARHAKRQAAANDPGVPAIGDAHPSISGINATGKTATPVDPNSSVFRVAVQYGVQSWRNSPGIIAQELTLDTTIVEEKTWFDVNGERLRVGPLAVPGAVITQYPQGTRVITHTTATISKLETTTEALLFQRSIDYVGAVNNGVWFGWDPKTWYLEDLQVRRSDIPTYSEVQYRLVYNPETWRLFANIIVNRTMPDNPNAFAYFDVRRFVNFDLLPVTIPVKT